MADSKLQHTLQATEKRKADSYPLQSGDASEKRARIEEDTGDGGRSKLPLASNEEIDTKQQTEENSKHDPSPNPLTTSRAADSGDSASEGGDTFEDALEEMNDYGRQVSDTIAEGHDTGVHGDGKAANGGGDTKEGKVAQEEAVKDAKATEDERAALGKVLASGTVSKEQGVVDLTGDIKGDETTNTGKARFDMNQEVDDDVSASNDEGGEDESEEDEDDLFKNTFLKSNGKSGKVPEADNSSTKSSDSDADGDVNNAVEVIHKKVEKVEKKAAKPSKPAPAPPADPTKPRGPMLKDIPARLRNHNELHKRSLAFLPRMYLKPHRYWIGVVNNLTKQNKYPGSQDDVIWMRGNRLITVRTVWHMVSQRSAETEFVLMHEGVAYGSKRLDQMECLDLFNDKRIIFRAVPSDHPKAVGERLAPTPPFVVPAEVITIDDD